MKFLYEYRTSDNARHSGVVDAPDREAAFRTLKAQGVRPGRLTEAPGFFNALFGKGKRWIAISVLAAVLVAVLVKAGTDRRAARDRARFASEDRAQLFGDPAVLQKLAHNGWRDTFPDEGEAFLARHAVPGKICDCAPGTDRRPPRADAIASALMARKDAPLAIGDADGDELKKMKRMVNGMKREFAAYVEPDPGAEGAGAPDALSQALDYIGRCCERCRIEKGVYDGFARELAILARKLEDLESSDAPHPAPDAPLRETWDKKNAALRAMGLATIPQPE